MSKRAGAIAPGENGMRKAALPQVGWIIEVEFIAGGVAALRPDGNGDRPWSVAVIFQLDRFRRVIGAAGDKQ